MMNTYNKRNLIQSIHVIHHLTSNINQRYLNEILITDLVYEQQITDIIKVLNNMKYHTIIRLKLYKCNNIS
jgi:hypothetical protein